MLRKGHLHGSQLPHNPAVVVLDPLVAHKSTLHARSTEEGTREGKGTVLVYTPGVGGCEVYQQHCPGLWMIHAGDGHLK